MPRKPRRITERHILALNLLCYLPILFEPRITAGIVGYITQTYSPLLPKLLGIWVIVSVIYLFLFKAKPIAYIVCGFPIIAHWIMGVWWWVGNLENVPIGAVFLPFAIFIDINWLVYTRIRGMAEGRHDDDTLHNRSD